ncbi:hypothetical protein [Piscinibacter sp.]|jgi:hypothetical protein|uniref:hypothetical protein n=1 Tax=Piscinibacter sp. TaxID=1903157 RepID=UPI002E01ECD8|nr:hypothetical protein [Burkholderiaceae bacterium]
MSKKLATLAALAVVAGAALATVTFDAATGKGFVGKGDVQLAFGWNNAKLQSQAGNVSFTYVLVETSDYEVTCEFDTPGTKRSTHHVQTTHKSLSDSLSYDATKANRLNPQGDVTAFNLTGITNLQQTSSGDPIPNVGAGCPGNSGLGLITDVSVTSSTSTGGLYVSDAVLGLGPVLIWSTPAY